MIFAQGPWEFSTPGSTENWIVSSTNTVTQSGNDLSVNFITGAGNNPVISNATAGIDADTNIKYLEVRLKNLSAATFLRFGSYATATTGNNYVNQVITANDTDYKTYTIDVTAWVGNPVGVVILCKTNNSTTAGSAYVATTGQSILIDYIKPLASIPSPEVNTFTFDSSTQGFTTLTRSTAVQATESTKGTLQINCTTQAATSAIVALAALTAHVEGANKYAHVTLKNTSTNNSFTLRGYVGLVNTIFSPTTTTITTGDSGYTTYDFDLSTWNSGYQQPEFLIGNKDTWSAAPTTYAINDIVIVTNTYYKSLTGVNTAADAAALKLDTTNWAICDSTGAISPAPGAIVGSLMDIVNPIYIDQIVFDNVALGTNDFKQGSNMISLYPNPAHEVLNINSSNPIAKIEVYDMLGKKVASKNNASDINVADLGKGVYILSVFQANGSVVAKQFVKE